MIRVALSDLAKRLGGQLRLPDTDQGSWVTGFATDTRKVHPGDLFLAIRGAYVDGHALVEDAIRSGAVAAIVERGVAVPHILVPNLVSALARMARTYRDEFTGHVIGVTGSAGKSSTKEFIAAALGQNVLKTEGNRNTEYTAPLLWAEVEPHHKAVVVEMGMRGLGQIAQLSSFSRPTIGVITNIGIAHVSELGSRDAIARAKGELFEALPEDGVAVFWAEDDYADVLRSIAGSNRKIVTFGLSERADARVVRYEPVSWRESALKISFEGKTYSTTIPVIGEQFALNAAAAFTAAVVAGADPSDVARRMASTNLPPMRMSVRDVGDVTYLLDMYNASPPGVIGALLTVAESVQRIPTRFVAILGEMRELGDLSERGHREVGTALAESGVFGAVLLAANPAAPTPFVAALRQAAIEAGMPASNIRIASSHDEVKAYLSGLVGPHVVLVKGSRAVELERAMPEGVL